MRVFRGLRHPDLAPSSALTIGNFDGVHRGHQAMLALLVSEAAHRGLPPTVMSFEPNPRDYFAARAGKPEPAPARIAPLRDKLGELARCGIQQVVILRFDAALAAQSPEAFIDRMLVEGLGVGYVLVGDDFRFGARRAGDYAMLDAAGASRGFDVARMMSYEVHGHRVSSSAVRAALAAGDMKQRRGPARPALQHQRPRHPRRQARPRARRKRQRPRRRLSHPEPALSASAPGGDGRLRRPGPRPGRRAAGRRGQPGPAADDRRQRPGPARNALSSIGPPSSAARGATVNSSAWNCLPNCATKRATTRSRPCAGAIRGDAEAAHAWLAAEAKLHAATGRQTTRDRI